jgi:hypothetical protein
MKLRLWIGVVALTLLAGAFPAQANIVDVSATVSGTPGSYTYDFSVTNNIGGTNDIYGFDVSVNGAPFGNITNSPPSWGPRVPPNPGANEWCFNGNCFYSGTTNLPPGATVSGFEVQSATLFTSIDWEAAAEGGNLGNPVFTGTVSVSPSPVPGLGLASLAFLVFLAAARNVRRFLTR